MTGENFEDPREVVAEYVRIAAKVWDEFGDAFEFGDCQFPQRAIAAGTFDSDRSPFVFAVGDRLTFVPATFASSEPLESGVAAKCSIELVDRVP